MSKKNFKGLCGMIEDDMRDKNDLLFGNTCQRPDIMNNASNFS